MARALRRVAYGSRSEACEAAGGGGGGGGAARPRWPALARVVTEGSLTASSAGARRRRASLESPRWLTARDALRRVRLEKEAYACGGAFDRCGAGECEGDVVDLGARGEQRRDAPIRARAACQLQWRAHVCCETADGSRSAVRDRAAARDRERLEPAA